MKLRPVAVPAVLALLVVAGCQARGNDGQAPPNIVTTIGTPSATAQAPTITPTAPPIVAPTTSKPPAPAPGYPSSAEPYAKAVIAAWKAKDWDRVADLASAEVHEQLLEIPGPIDMTWAFEKCEGAAGSSYCHFRNETLDVVIVRISNQSLGQAHAAVGVQLQPHA